MKGSVSRVPLVCYLGVIGMRSRKKRRGKNYLIFFFFTFHHIVTKFQNWKTKTIEVLILAWWLSGKGLWVRCLKFVGRVQAVAESVTELAKSQVARHSVISGPVSRSLHPQGLTDFPTNCKPPTMAGETSSARQIKHYEICKSYSKVYFIALFYSYYNFFRVFCRI